MPRRRRPGPRSQHNAVGAATELIVAADLLSRGYEVFRSMAGTCSCDLIAMRDIDDGCEFQMLRVEAKTAHLDKRDGNSVSYDQGNPEEYDVLAVYHPWSKTIVYLPDGVVEQRATYAAVRYVSESGGEVEVFAKPEGFVKIGGLQHQTFRREDGTLLAILTTRVVTLGDTGA